MKRILNLTVLTVTAFVLLGTVSVMAIQRPFALHGQGVATFTIGEGGIPTGGHVTRPRTASGSLPALCEACSAGDGILLSPEQASAVTGIAARLIYRWVEAGTIHYKEAANGQLTVCVKTLMVAGERLEETTRS